MAEEKRFTRATWKIMEQLLEVDSLEDALSGSLEIIVEALNSEAGAIWLLDPKTDRLSPLFHIGPADLSNISVENGLGIEGMVTKMGQSIRIEDAASDPRFDGSALNKYTVVKEMTAGKGYADVTFIPYQQGLPAMIIELKHNKCVEGALAQIKDKRYFDSLAHYQGNLLLVGISYDEKEKKHTCKIEKFEK